MFLNKKILIGITASISAYKMYSFIRLIKQQGAEIKVIITPSAKNFVSTTLLSTFSEHKVYVDFVEEDIWQNHVHLGRWADLFVIAPSSCNTIAKLANGISDNFLIATYLSCTSPVVIYPAMDEDMWLHPSTQHNIQLLQQRGNEVVEPSVGLLASGLYGKGRLPEANEMMIHIEETYFRNASLSGKKILITAGPTEEPIDPVRMITNRSSGKMGYAIAEFLYKQGAEVYLITGPVSIQVRYKGIHVVQVNTASEMFDACAVFTDTYDIAIFTAAVADFTITHSSEQKIKKSDNALELKLVQTKDILATFGKHKKDNQKIIGFALETEKGEAYAKIKLSQKNADLMVMNQVENDNSCFNQDTMRVSFVAQNQTHDFDTMPKLKIAEILSEYIIKNWV
jgi:phosphopantothenoylcysteine decarboxylase/phosphopantothenate--cysteine ligase